MSSQGPNNGGTFADAGDGDETWSFTSGALPATCIQIHNGEVTDSLVCTNFGFSIPSDATINGFGATYTGYASATGLVDNAILLIVGGSAGGTNQSTGRAVPTTSTQESYGGSSNLWGLTPTATQINASNFGVQFQWYNPSGGNNLAITISAITMTVYYTPAPTACITTVTYDAVGRPVATIDPLSKRTSFAYDVAGRQVRVVDPLGNINTSIYDRASRLVATIDPLLHRTSYAYDGASRRVRTTDARGSITTSVFDAASRQVALIDANANRTSFTYDAARRLTRTTDPLGYRTTNLYDADNRLARRTDARGLLTTHVYDAASRLTGLRYNDGTRVTQIYDAASRRTALNDSTGRTSFSYDPASRLTSTISPAALRL